MIMLNVVVRVIAYRNMTLGWQ